MEKVILCPKCKYKVDDSKFCPECGAKINNEVKKMNKTRKILLVILAITIIAAALLVGTALLNHTQTVQISDTASLEMPVGNGIKSEHVKDTNVLKLTNGKGVVIMSYNSKNSNLADAFGFALLKEFAVGGKDNEDQIYETTVNGSKVYSIATGNDTTHDNILISTHSKEDTMNIYHSIKYNTSNVKNTTNTTTAINNNTTTKNPTSTTNKNINTDKPTGMDEQTYNALIKQYGSYENYQKALDKQAEVRSYGSDEAYNTANGYPTPTPTPTPSGDTGGSGSGVSAGSTAT